jgi:chromosome partitioning protein
MSLIGVNALVAADAVLIPVSPHFLAIQGLISLLGSVDQIRTRLKVPARVLGILLTMTDGSAQTTAAREQILSTHGDLLFNTEIGAARTFDEAASNGQAVSQFSPRSAAAECFASLAGEVLDRVTPV